MCNKNLQYLQNVFWNSKHTKANKLETKLSNLKMGDIDMVKEDIARFKNMNANIIQARRSRTCKYCSK